jgi:hypothetical protein
MSDGLVVQISVFSGGISSKPTSEDKATKAEAKYRPMDDPKEQCGNCSHYMAGRCEIVVGSIDPDYVCDWWEER